MFVTFKPDDSEIQEWEFDPTDLLESEAEQIERQYRKLTEPRASYDEWQLALFAGSSPARRILLWHLTRIDHPRLRFEDTPDFRRKQLQCEFSRGELVEIRERVAKSGKDPRAVQEALDMLDAEIANARDSLDEDAGKA